MSLLDGRSEVTVHVPVMGRDEFGTLRQVSSEPVRVRCTPQWLTSKDAGDVEMAPGSTLRVIARDWPGQAGTVFDWRGDRFEQAGPGKRMYGSPRTAHWEVLARHVGRIEGNG